jgi:DNA-binding transcriptional MerR regulator
MTNTYTIGQVADILGVTASTLRFYDKEGLLPFVKRTTGGIRSFSDTDIEWLRIIECMKKARIPLEDIKVYIVLATQGDDTIPQRLEIFLRQKEKLQKEMEELQKTMMVLNYKCWFYKTAEEYHSTEKVSSMSDDEIPAEFVKIRQELKKHN